MNDQHQLSPQGQSLSRILWELHDKPERVAALALAADRVPSRDLAVLFGEVWTNSESLFQNKMQIVSLIHALREAGETEYAMSAIENTRLRMLKSKGTVTLFRGAADHNRKGYSWTTKRETALLFAKRNGLDGKPLLLKATFQADDLVFCFNGRNEFEVVVDLFSDTAQDAMNHAKVTKLPEREVTAADMLAWKVQSLGNDAIFKGDEAAEAERSRILLQVVTLKNQGRPLEGFTSFLEERARLLEEFGFDAKATEFRKKAELATAIWDEPETDVMAKHFAANAA